MMRSWIKRLLYLAGLHLAPRFLTVLAIIGLAVMVALLSLVRYSESPRFCHSCHIMEPYYQAWKTSKHNSVACVECHYPPGSPRTLLWKKFQALSQVAKYVTRTYSSKPFAEIEDASCLRSGCHSTRLLKGKVVTANGIKFDHRPHLEERRKGRQLRCVSCHSQVVVGKHIEVTYDTCYLCHFKGMGKDRDFKPLGGCLGCHTLPTQSFPLGNMTYNHKDFVTQRGLACQNCHRDVVRGEGDAPRERCFACHNQPEKLARYGESAFMHDTHVTRHNIACFHCHQEMHHGFNEGRHARLGKPGLPHPPMALASNCTLCHQNKHAGQRHMYSGRVSALGFPDMPSPMYLANVDCSGCHYQEKADVQEKEFRGKTFKASEEACVKCHGPRFKGIWADTKKELNESLSQLDKKRTLTRSALEKLDLPSTQKQQAQNRMDQADRWHHFVHASRGEHNIYLASWVLRKENDALSETGRELKIDLPDLNNLPLLSGGYCATLCHSKIGVKVPPETVQAFGKTMPHKAHAEMMGCAQCHDIGAHKRVPLRQGVKTLCAGCHPTGEDQ